ncbi:hypothetical protein [Paenibacillus segetis]|uniref:hypothetical protein n=1 Tax=Paenibacillus segetis TaxID=1325360 RepID=UPI001E4E02CD|nr:hypothetical protein [Paenibacillus segetis]
MKNWNKKKISRERSSKKYMRAALADQQRVSYRTRRRLFKSSRIPSRYRASDAAIEDSRLLSMAELTIAN